MSLQHSRKHRQCRQHGGRRGSSPERFERARRRRSIDLLFIENGERDCVGKEETEQAAEGEVGIGGGEGCVFFAKILVINFFSSAVIHFRGSSSIFVNAMASFVWYSYRVVMSASGRC